MRVETIEEYVVFCRHMNFSKAAKELFITQPSLSNHIAALEKELGCTLVDRGSEPKTLTPAGEVLLSRSHELLDAYHGILEDIGALADAPSETLVLENPICSPLAASELSGVIARFLSENPGIGLRRSRHSTIPLWDVLTSGMADIGFLWRPPNASETVDDELFTIIPIPGATKSNTMVWVHKTHPLAGKDSITIKDLERQKVVLPSQPEYSVFSKQADKAIKRYGVGVRTVFKAGDYLDVCSTIRDDELLLSDASDAHDSKFFIASQRVFLPIEGDELSCEPCFVVSKANEKPALSSFLRFLEGLGSIA